MIKLVIFDLDDTLISKKKFIEEGFRIIALKLYEKYGFSVENTYQRLLTSFPMELKKCLIQILDEERITYTNEDIQEFVTIYHTAPRKEIAYEDTSSFIQLLRKYQISIGIIVDGPIEEQKCKLKTIHAYDVFDYIEMVNEAGIEQQPMVFEKLISQAGVLPEETMYIGDDPAKDFYIKKFIKMKTVRIIREDSLCREAEYLEDIKEDYTVKRLGEIRI